MDGSAFSFVVSAVKGAEGEERVWSGLELRRANLSCAGGMARVMVSEVRAVIWVIIRLFFSCYNCYWEGWI